MAALAALGLGHLLAALRAKPMIIPVHATGHQVSRMGRDHVDATATHTRQEQKRVPLLVHG